MTDDEIIEYFDHHKLKSASSEIIEYLKNRFDDSLSLYESIYRIRHKIYNKPICPICNNVIEYDTKYSKFHITHSGECCRKWKAIKNKQVFLEKYGVDNPWKSEEVKQKIKETCFYKYGDQNYRNINKAKVTFIEKYGVDNPWKSEEIKQKIKETLSLKYGSPTFNNRQKAKETNLVRYGVDSYARTNDFKQNYKNHLKEYKYKEYKTKKKNHTFNTSKLEIKTFELLKEKYPDVIYQYRDKNRYPFVCDFYIPSLDLFIECNYHWTHGGKPYEGTEEDNKIIDGWKSKNSQYYNNAINCWTIRDVNKRNIAKQNNLNYIEVWNINEIYTYLNNENYTSFK